MKIPPSFLASLATACSLLGSKASLAGLPAAPIRESEQAQAHIQGETRVLADTLDAMLGEYERNHLAGDEAAAARRVRESLGSLSSTEMRQVVDLLQRARAATDPDAAVKTVADAFTTQKQIIGAIQRILAEHMREQEAAEISRQLNGLADRQARNLQNGIALGRMMAGGRNESSEAVQQAQLETQRGEQSAIAEEVRMARGKITRLAANPGNGGATESFKTAAKQIERVEPVAAAAAESLKAGQLFKAATDEKVTRDELRKVARQIAPREQGTAALRKAERELAEIVAEQRQLREATAQQRPPPDLDRWLAEKLAANDRNDALPRRLRDQPVAELRENAEIRERFETEQQMKDAEIAQREDEQGELAGKTEALAQKLSEVPLASAGLEAATGKMQEAQAALQEAKAPQAAQQQDVALAQLAVAQAALKKSADEAEARANPPMAQDEKTHAANLPSPAQMAEAMNQLAQARQQVQQAQKNLQQAAEQNGQQAAQNAAQAAEQAAQAAQQAAEAAKAAQQQAAQAENPQAAQPAGQAAQQAAQAAKAAQQAAQNARKAAVVPGQQAAAAQQAAQQAGQAAQAAQQAAAAAQKAQQAAQQGAQQAAQAGQQAAQNSNQQAAQQAGQAAQAAQQAAMAAQQAQQMAQAAAQAAQGGSQPANASMQQAAQQLAQATQSTGQASAQTGAQTSPSAQQAMQQAAQQLSAATSQAAGGQNSAAQQSAQNAAQSLAQAQATMAAQQAGLSPSQSAAPMPGRQGQGKGQGTQPGQGQGQGSGKSSQAANGPSQGAESYTPGDPKAVERGAREAALKKADFIGLPARERAAIEQSLREKYPQEYGALVEQYLLNLANESAKK